MYAWDDYNSAALEQAREVDWQEREHVAARQRMDRDRFEERGDLGEGPWCRIRAEGCAGRAVHRHHRKRRSQCGEDTGPNIVAVCAPCHDLIHRSGKLAYEMGWLVKSWDDPASVPLLSERRRAA